MAIYLDYSATTPTRPEVIAEMTQVLQSEWGNPASIHRWGERALLVMERARQKVAELINADPEGIVFTSGGTESNNTAIMVIARQYLTPQHIIISAIEHSAISQPVNYLESLGWQVTRLPVDREGRVSPHTLAQALQANTVLVSIIYAHNEIGTIQEIDKLGAICRQAGVLLHTDAVQAVGHIPIDVQRQPIDLLSLSGHKFYAPQGIGALYIHPQVGRQFPNFIPLLMGGGQEQNRRSGTPAVALIAGLGKSAELAGREMVSEIARLQDMRDRLYRHWQNIPDLIPVGSLTQRLPHHLSFAHRRISGRQIVHALNRRGIAISSGSACSSGTSQPSNTLLALGYGAEIARGGIRISLGRETTQADIDQVAIALAEILENLA